jgi:hypothetical protein
MSLPYAPVSSLLSHTSRTCTAAQQQWWHMPHTACSCKEKVRKAGMPLAPAQLPKRTHKNYTHCPHCCRCCYLLTSCQPLRLAVATIWCYSPPLPCTSTHQWFAAAAATLCCCCCCCYPPLLQHSLTSGSAAAAATRFTMASGL